MRAKHIIISLLFGALSISFSCAANQNDCFIKGNEFVHCAFITGLDRNNLQNGRFIKVMFEGRSKIACLNDSSVFVLFNNDANQLFVSFNNNNSANRLVTNLFYTYSICADRNGTSCELIGNDSFPVTRLSSNILAAATAFPFVLTAFPNTYFVIDLSQDKDNFPTCDARQELVSLKFN